MIFTNASENSCKMSACGSANAVRLHMCVSHVLKEIQNNVVELYVISITKYV